MTKFIIMLTLASVAVAQQFPSAAPPCTATRTANCTPKTDASGSWDASGATHTLPIKKGVAASKPATCTVGEEYFATDATAGTNEYYCTATNTWTQQTGTGGGGGGGNATMTIDLPAGGYSSGILTTPWDIASSGGGGNSIYHAIDLSNSGSPYYRAAFRLPANFDASKTVSVLITGGNSNGVTGNVSVGVQIACYGAGQSTLSDVSYNTMLSISITQGSNVVTAGSASGLALGTCDSDMMARVKLSRDNTIGSNLADVYSVHDVALKYGTK